jgi:hypothetical protein
MVIVQAEPPTPNPLRPQLNARVVGHTSSRSSIGMCTAVRIATARQAFWRYLAENKARP